MVRSVLTIALLFGAAISDPVAGELPCCNLDVLCKEATASENRSVTILVHGMMKSKSGAT